MVSIALINPPSPFLISDNVMPPLGLMYLSSYLKQHGIKATILDLAVNPDCDLKGYDIYAITSTTPQYPEALKILSSIKKINPRTLFVIGGAHATAFRHECHGFDSIVIGEGEEALLSICRFKERSKNSKICGLVEARQIPDIDSIPFPDRTFKGFDKYHYNINGLPATTMMSSRGCPFNCYFCCNTWGNKVRLRSSDNVLKEARELKFMGFKGIMFFDDTFTVDKHRVKNIAIGLKELGMVWRCFIHANTVDSNLLRIMQQCGCIEVGMGVESGNNEILKAINKKIDLERAIEVCDRCHEIGLRIKTFLMTGLPGESKETIKDTINFLKRARPNDYDITCYTPFPETEIWNNTEKFDIIFDKLTLDYSKLFYKGKFGEYTAQVSTSHLSSEDIEKCRDYIESLKGEICAKTT